MDPVLFNRHPRSGVGPGEEADTLVCVYQMSSRRRCEGMIEETLLC